MAEREESVDPLKELKFFGLILLGLFVVWYLAGGYERSKGEGALLKPPAPIDSGETYGPGQTNPPPAKKITPPPSPSSVDSGPPASQPPAPPSDVYIVQ